MDGTGGTATAERSSTPIELRQLTAPAQQPAIDDGDVVDRQPPDGPSGRRSRRSILGAVGAGSVAVVAAACVPQSNQPAPTAAPTPGQPAPPAPVPWTVEQARTLANRATFGATKAEVDRISTLGAAGWVDEQLARSRPDAERLLGSNFPSLNASNAVNDVQRSTDDSVLFRELDHAMLLRAVNSENQLYEVMCDFWSNHFTVWRSAKWLTQLKTRDDADVIRRHALGRFVDMMQASAKSPAMLVYLDNYTSNAYSTAGVNENWGREILELHTLGIIKGEQVYTEADMRGVAKIMSGRTIRWNNDANKYNYMFSTGWHSRDAVSILGGQWTRPARANGNSGEADGDALLGFLARHPSTARHLAYKLCRRFVSDDPPAALVDRLLECV
ncbi:MAG TPA: DUF1800 family protein, partial [Microthrixaceae bacterium]|nr:DUF1800 family protein [Microthrixaceae bacterium]